MKLSKIGTNIDLLIKRSGLDVQTVARRSGLSLRGFNYIRSGERSPSLKSLEAIARVFGITASQLIAPTLEQDIENKDWLNRMRSAFCSATPEAKSLLKSAIQAAETMSRVQEKGPTPVFPQPRQTNEETLRVLNEVVSAQHRQIEQLQATCRFLLERVKSVAGAAVKGTPAEELPPHY